MPLPSDIIAAVARRLAEHAGLELPAWVVETRTAARIAALGLDAAAYVAAIQSARGAGELDQLVEAVRVGESRLFRHRSQLAALIERIAPQLRGKRAIRVWSAGCAAGEEPYTLAVVLARLLPGSAISILATDISAEAIEVARAASYPATALADVPPEWRDGFVLDGDRVRVRPELAALVRFERANLVDGAVPRDCDLVWCRNVLIYFTPPARRRALERLVTATRPGGFVFVGYSESLRDLPELEPVRAGDAVYYVRRDADPFVARPPAAPPRPTPAAGVLVVHGVNRTPPFGVPVLFPEPTGAAPTVPLDEDRTPPPILIPPLPPAEDVLALRGQPAARWVTAELTARLGIRGLVRLVVDLDGAEILGDDLVPVLRRARAAAEAAGVRLELRTTRSGPRRWLTRHELG